MVESVSSRNRTVGGTLEWRIDLNNRAAAKDEGRIMICEDINTSGDSMERRKEAMPISSLGQSTVASMESTPVNGSRRETPRINLLLGPLAALLVWLLVGGWFYFFGLPPG